jgi:uncharacterized OB-fold protein
MSDVKRVPAVEGLFADTAGGARLLGSRCDGCQTSYFPRSETCHNPDCDASRMNDAEFGPRGTLWSLAIQNYQPPPPVLSPEPYRPYAVGLVDMPGGLRVLGRIATGDPMAVEVGCEVELVIEPLARSEAGEDIVSWQFKPL